MTGWDEGRRVAWRLGADAPTPGCAVPVGGSAGRTVRAAVQARLPLPAFDNSAMDGWAVSGEGPWWEGAPVLAGSTGAPEPLRPGEARPIATGAPVPPGTLAIVRSEHAGRNGGDGSVITVALEPGRRLEAEADIRRRGEELAGGETLLAPGSLITPPLAGLLAAAGIAQVEVAGELRVATLAIGDELVDGDARDDASALGLVRDSLTPQLGPILGMLGASPVSAQRIPDRPEAVADAVRSADADLVVTTGGTARGPADPLRAALAGLGAHPVLDGLALRPGGSVLLSHLPSGRRVLSLPGNPFAAVVDLLLLGSAFIDGALGRPLADLRACGLPEGLQRLAVARAVACVETEGALRPVAHQRSGMLRGLTEATHLVLVPASSEPETASARALPLPWS